VLRDLLRRLFGRRARSRERSTARAFETMRPSEEAARPTEDADQRIDAARDRLKSTIRPPEDEGRGPEE
jgi:hypothetical protein